MAQKTYFGRPGKIREYRLLLYIGLGMTIVGTSLMSLSLLSSLDGPGNMLPVTGAVALFFGLICALSGWIGIREEQKKHGVARTPTREGTLALAFGMASVFVVHLFPLPFVLGGTAVALAVMAAKKGDNVYGSTGGVAGSAGITVELYAWMVLTAFP